MKVRLASLTHEWTLPTLDATADVTLVPVEIPPAAWLHPSAERYVTDLLAVVDVGGMRWLSEGALAWPGGVRSAPEVWALEEIATRAPQGVLDPSLRDPRLADDDRIVPDVSDVAPEPAWNVDLVLAEGEVEP